jgi:5-(carboxyamino)imidazole ribonucleotide mutase
MAKAKVLILAGSDSDGATVKYCCEILIELKIPYDAEEGGGVRSAHRTPELLHEAASRAEEAGFKLGIGFAGGSAHLQGMSAAATVLPILGVAAPSSSSPINDVAAILSQICMPAGVPLFYMGMGKQGAINAAVGAAKMLALGDPELRERLRQWLAKQAADSKAKKFDLGGLPLKYDGE